MECSQSRRYVSSELSSAPFSFHHIITLSDSKEPAECPRVSVGSVFGFPKRSLLHSISFVDYCIRILETFRW